MDATTGVRHADGAGGRPLAALQNINQQDFETLIDILATSEIGDEDTEAGNAGDDGGQSEHDAEGLSDRTAMPVDLTQAGSTGRMFDGDATITQESVRASSDSRQRRSKRPVAKEPESMLSQPTSPNLAGIEAPSSVISPLLLATSLPSESPDAQPVGYSTSVQYAFSEPQRSVFKDDHNVCSEIKDCTVEPYIHLLIAFDFL